VTRILKAAKIEGLLFTYNTHTQDCSCSGIIEPKDALVKTGIRYSWADGAVAT